MLLIFSYSLEKRRKGQVTLCNYRCEGQRDMVIETEEGMSLKASPESHQTTILLYVEEFL
jgi:hypothetical protein